MRLIDAVKLKKAIEKTEYFNHYAYSFICDIIDMEPTIYPEELTPLVAKMNEVLPDIIEAYKEAQARPMSMWILNDPNDVFGEYCYSCNKCGKHFWLTKPGAQKIYKYCPNCGAYMGEHDSIMEDGDEE